MTKILLINYSAQDAKRVSNELCIEVQRGYIADSGTYTENHLGVSSPVINFYIPESFAEFQAVFINFNIDDKIKQEFKSKVNSDYAENGKHFLTDYWFRNRGYLVIFTGKDLADLSVLGVPLQASMAQQTDRTARFGINLHKGNPFRLSLHEQLKNIQMPATHYLSIQDDDEIKKYLEGGHLDRVYRNSNSKTIGLYIDGKEDKNDYGWEDSPQVMVLPTFKSLSNITVALTRSFSTLSPKSLPLSDTEWLASDTYYPKSVATYQEEIDETLRLAEQKVEDLKKSKTDEIERLSPYLGVLTQTGDELVESTQWLLSSVLGLEVIDADNEKEAGNRKEDLLITKSDGTKILAEVKGTRAEYPSPKYIGQATNHYIRKSKLGAVKCILILNHDYETEPRLRKQGYTGDDSELLDSVEYVSYLDTRVLHKICIAVTDGDMSSEEAVEIITASGRIEYETSETK